MRLKAYPTAGGCVPFVDWFDALDVVQKRAVRRRLRALEEVGHFGTRKNLRGRLHELTFRQPVRIYFAEIGGEAVLLLGGSGKGNQRREIAKARERLQEFLQRR